MTIESLGWAWKQELPATEKLVLIYLADNTDEWQQIRVTILAEFSGKSEKKVWRALRELDAKSLIKLGPGPNPTDVKIQPEQLNNWTPGQPT